MAAKKIKQLNYGYLIEKEKEIEKLTSKTYEKPLKTLDNTFKFFLNSLDLALKIHESTKKKDLKNYCKFYLTVGNAIIHILRTSRKALLQGYYGSIAVLFRTVLNYLNMSIYIHHHPEDVELLLKESQEDFSKNKKYKKKFHEFSLKQELKKIGYKLPDETNVFAKLTHGSLWGAQVFGWRSLEMGEGEYELNYSPKFGIRQSSTLLSFLLGIPTDFARYFILHTKNEKIKGFNELRKAFIKTEREVFFTLKALENSYQFLKYAPKELQEAIIKKMKQNET